ncbi:MAG: hypothetical protein HZA52_13965 [Planctomycetes bacterium]|nr:hypothetical protein [Planctomycetota bacterium]
MAPPDQAPPRRARLWKKLALVVGSLAIALLLAEGGTRAFLAIRGKAFDAEATRLDVLNTISTLNDNVPRWNAPREETNDPKQAEVLHPYFGIDAAGYIEDLANVVTYFQSEAATRNYDIAILGGSVAAIFAAEGAESFIEELRKDPRFAKSIVRYWSLGRGAYKQPQQTIVLHTMLSLGIEFDAVLLLDGFNEVAITRQNATMGEFPLYPTATKWLARASNPAADRELLDAMMTLRARQLGVTRQARRILDWGIWRSALASLFALKSLTRARGDAMAHFQRVSDRLAKGTVSPTAAGPRFDPDPAAVMRSSVKAWVMGSRAISALCREHGMTFLHVLQPTLHDTGSKPRTPQEIEKGASIPSWEEGARLGYPELRAASAQLIERGIAFYDASRLFAEVEETLYYDSCHFNALGNQMLGRALGRPFLDAAAANPNPRADR